MKLIILTQYFPPEVGAPQNRLFELAVRLHRAGVEIQVLTAMPNYPQMVIHPEYRGKRYVFENMDGLEVHRAPIYVSGSRSIVSRLLNYFSFVWHAWRVGKKHLRPADFLMVESPPLFLGMAARRLARRKGARMIFNVSDLWPESAEKLGLVNNRLLLKMAYRLEARLYKASVLVTGQTQGIVRSVNERFPAVRTAWLPNGVDPDFYDATRYDRSWRMQAGFAENDILLLYAGIIGHAQGLEIILKAASRLRDRPEIHFILLGSGPEKEKLISMKAELGVDHVHFFDAVKKDAMPAILAACDAVVIPLRKLELFKGAIPSKIFESLAMEKPLLLGVEGEASELFIRQGQAGLAFEPDNDQALAEAVLTLTADQQQMLSFGKNGKAYVRTHFNRDRIAAGLLDTLQKL